jgi:hypothetical protein
MFVSLVGYAVDIRPLRWIGRSAGDGQQSRSATANRA